VTVSLKNLDFKGFSKKTKKRKIWTFEFFSFFVKKVKSYVFKTHFYNPGENR